MRSLKLLPLLGVFVGGVALLGCSDDATTTKDAGADQRVGDLVSVDGVSPGDGAQKDQAPTLDGPLKVDGPVATDGPIPADCPKSEPTAGLACTQAGKQCGYGTGPECGNVWECSGNKWALAFQGTNCASVPPAGCNATQPSGFCTSPTGPCRYDEVVCTCVNVCSGVQPPPNQTHAWSCANPRTVACPSTTPTNASACTSEGLVCNYGNCGGSTATCTSGKWNVVFQPPPP